MSKLDPRRQLCPECGHDQVSTRLVTEDLPYGEGRGAVTLKVEIPVRRCPSCGLEFTDAAADEIRDAAIRRRQALKEAEGK